MSRSRRFTVFVPLVSIFAALSLSAMAEESPPKKPAPKAPAVQQKGPMRPGPQVGHGPPGHGGPPARAVEHHPMGRDPGHWTDHDRYAWGHGNWRPYGCHFGRCGYWWWADGYWYFYDHPMEGPPVDVSEYAYPDPSAPPPSEGYAEPPPPPPPPPPGSGVVGGAIGGSIIGGILGGALTGRAGGAAVGAIIGGTTGAAIGAQSEQRNGYYLYQGACYYRYPTGEFAVIDPGYCN